MRVPNAIALVASMSTAMGFIPQGQVSKRTICPIARTLPFTTFVRTKCKTKMLAGESDKNDNDSREELVLDDSEVQVINGLFARQEAENKNLDQLVSEALPTMNPQLILKLRKVQANIVYSASEKVNQVATVIEALLNKQMEDARDLLAKLLSCGEIRKLDASIGKAAREGKLDMAFFTVLDMNLSDAQQQQQQQSDEEDGKASRAQILQHIYTRCQEEVEKNVPPGTALLNKLLRTDVDEIRKNQLEHYLCPQKNVIASPDGKEVDLGTRPVLVPPSQLVEAMAIAVKQVRTLQQAGGASPSTAAAVVESCRQVAMEARFVIGNNYGRDSEELKSFEEGLQPVFRPTSPDSVYVRGE